MDKEWQARSNRSPEPKETTCVPEFEQFAPATQQRPWESNAREPQNKNHMAKTNSRSGVVRARLLLARGQRMRFASPAKRSCSNKEARRRRRRSISRAARRSVCGDAAERSSASARTGAHANSHSDEEILLIPLLFFI